MTFRNVNAILECPIFVFHEEDTYGFLVGLPIKWRPIFAGKLLVVAASAALLAAALSIVGWLLCPFRKSCNSYRVGNSRVAPLGGLTIKPAFV